MEKERIVVILRKSRENIEQDIDIPLNITANELIIGLCEGYDLKMNTEDLSRCYLQTENPIALLRGNKKLSEYELRDGTIINYTR